jgi:hypothetical protein
MMPRSANIIHYSEIDETVNALPISSTSLGKNLVDRLPASSLSWIVRQLRHASLQFREISGERDALFLLYLNFTEEIYKMGRSCLLGVLFNAELTVIFWDQGSSSHSNSIAPSSRTSKLV